MISEFLREDAHSTSIQPAQPIEIINFPRPPDATRVSAGSLCSFGCSKARLKLYHHKQLPLSSPLFPLLDTTHKKVLYAFPSAPVNGLIIFLCVKRHSRRTMIALRHKPGISGELAIQHRTKRYKWKGKELTYWRQKF